MTEHLVAVFDTENAADAAARELENAGISTSAIRRYRPDQKEGAATGTSLGRTSETTSASGGGFWAWLLGEEPAAERTRSAYSRDEEWYHRRTHAGNAVLSVMIHDESRIHQAVTILEAHHPVEIEESTDEEATGSTAGSVAQVTAPSPAPTMGSGHPTGAGEAMPESASAASGSEEVIPIAEESIEVGKRTVDRGTARVRRYVVEKPVEREVTLHGERVTVERRRPLDTAVAGNAFEERTVEVRETEEVPISEKTARVVEEVAVRKEETERTETVRDTVRRDEVEVTDKDGRPASIR